MTSPLLSRAGAVMAEPPDAGIAAHYGDPYREQRGFAAALVDLSHRPVIAVKGPDRLSWLHSLTSQHLSELGVDRQTEALVLSPQGHVEHHLQLVDDGTTLLAHLEPGTAPDLLQFLDKMRFMLRVEVADVTAEWAVVQRGGTWELVPRATLGSYDGPLAGLLASEAFRIEARRPRQGLDTDHRTLPHEVGWLRSAVHLDKGCYRGQESVARVHNLGRPPRRLVLLHLDGSNSTLPAVGSAVTVAGREVGRMGTSARHHELGPIGLALIKRQVPDDAVLLTDGIAAAIDPVTEPDVPPSAARAAAAARAGLLRLPR